MPRECKVVNPKLPCSAKFGADPGRTSDLEELNLDYDGKRDRWNGFQPDDYKQVIEAVATLGGSRISWLFRVHFQNLTSPKANLQFVGHHFLTKMDFTEDFQKIFMSFLWCF